MLSTLGTTSSAPKRYDERYDEHLEHRRSAMPALGLALAGSELKRLILNRHLQYYRVAGNIIGGN